MPVRFRVVQDRDCEGDFEREAKRLTERAKPKPMPTDDA